MQRTALRASAEPEPFDDWKSQAIEAMSTGVGSRKRTAMVLVLKNLLFTLVVPGSVAVYVPLLLARAGRHRRAMVGGSLAQRRRHCRQEFPGRACMGR